MQFSGANGQLDAVVFAYTIGQDVALLFELLQLQLDRLQTPLPCEQLLADRVRSRDGSAALGKVRPSALFKFCQSGGVLILLGEEFSALGGKL